MPLYLTLPLVNDTMGGLVGGLRAFGLRATFWVVPPLVPLFTEKGEREI